MISRNQTGGGKSAAAVSQRSLRGKVYATTAGRCFYCGQPLQCGDEPQSRDWLLVRNRSRMIIEHKHPVVRGGAVDGVNTTPACFACNAAKAALTVDEFRLVRALRSGSLNLTFYADAPRPQRDWLCVHSREFERSIFAQAFPAGASAYSRGKAGAIRA